jgi:hypothetical protein
MNKKYLAYALVPMLGLGIIGAGAASIASAHGTGGGMMGFGGFGGFGQQATPAQIAERQTSQFQAEAELLGISVDEVKAAWAAGKNLKTLASKKGITAAQLKEKMQAKRQEMMKSHLDALVSQGVITQAQADQRLQVEQTRASQPHTGRGGKDFNKPAANQ